MKKTYIPPTTEDIGISYSPSLLQSSQIKVRSFYQSENWFGSDED